MSYQTTIIDIMRHGEPEGGEIFRGATDVPLTKNGFEQMRNAFSRLASASKIVSSPLQRCLAFAEFAQAELSNHLHIDEGFREISFGDWDGQSFEKVRQEDAERFKHYWQDPIQFAPPNAEPMPDFNARVQQAFQNLLAMHKGEHVLLITHGGVVRALISQILASDSVALMRYEVPYACISQIKVYHEADNYYPQLVYHNR